MTNAVEGFDELLISAGPATARNTLQSHPETNVIVTSPAGRRPWARAVSSDMGPSPDVDTQGETVLTVDEAAVSIEGIRAGHLLAGRAGIITLATPPQTHVTLGDPLKLNAITSAVIGECLLTGGPGSLVGVFIVAGFQHELIALGAPSAWFVPASASSRSWRPISTRDGAAWPAATADLGAGQDQRHAPHPGQEPRPPLRLLPCAGDCPGGLPRRRTAGLARRQNRRHDDADPGALRLPQADRGEVLLDATKVKEVHPKLAIDQGIETIQHSVGLCIDLSIARNFLLGRGPVRWFPQSRCATWRRCGARRPSDPHLRPERQRAGR